MRVADLRLHRRVEPLKYGLRDVPHLVIEPNLTCNLHCRNCYNVYRRYTKPLAQVRAEIDAGLRKRRAETISILGGEPTLHPDLPAIIGYVKQLGLTCQVLTNGVLLRQRPAVLDALVRAGCDRIVLHADVGQGRTPEELDAFIEDLFARFEEAGIAFSLVITVYPENRRAVPGLARRYARFRHFDGILATLAIDPFAAGRPTPAAPDAATLLDEHRAIAADLGVEPTTYVPSNLDDDSPRWLVYFYFLNSSTGRTVGISPRVDRLYRRLLRRLRGRYVFGAPVPPRWWPAVLAATLALELALSPRRAGEVRRLLAGSGWGRSLRAHYLVLQTGPAFDAARGAVELCYHCPDATIRNGLLTPVCLGDAINPLPGAGGPALEVDLALRQAVLEHMGEA